MRPPRRAEPGAEGASGWRQKGSASSAALDVRRAFSRLRIFDLATALLCWKRQESLVGPEQSARPFPGAG